MNVMCNHIRLFSTIIHWLIFPNFPRKSNKISPPAVQKFLAFRCLWCNFADVMPLAEGEHSNSSPSSRHQFKTFSEEECVCSTVAAKTRFQCRPPPLPGGGFSCLAKQVFGGGT